MTTIKRAAASAADETLIEATYIRHLRTLTCASGANIDVDLYRLADGTLVVAKWRGDSRQMPWIVDDSPEQYGIDVTAIA